MNDLQLAWKNLWRNRRRTLITAASIFFAIFFALVMRSFQLGAYEALFKNVIESYTGYIQIQHTDFADDPSIDNAIELDAELLIKTGSDPNVSAVVPRFESFALAAAGSKTQGVMVLGIDPEGEELVSDISSRLVKFRLTPESIAALKNEQLPERTKKLMDLFQNEFYASEGRLMLDLGISSDDSSRLLPLFRQRAAFRNEYIHSTDSGSILIGSGLSEFLKVNIGDSVVLTGQGYRGTTAAGLYRIAGIIKLPAPDIDNIIAYMPIDAARELFAATGLVTSAVVNLKQTDNESVFLTKKRIEEFVSEPLAVKTWQELNALLINQMEADNKSALIMLAVLYLVIAFGVFGTVLMMMAERRREFGMLVSIGMQKGRVAAIVTFEMIFIGLLGVAAGIAASLPIVFYGHSHPIRFTGEMARMYEDYGFDPVMPTMLPDTYFIWQSVVVMAIILFTILFSIRKIYRIKVIDALKA